MKPYYRTVFILLCMTFSASLLQAAAPEGKTSKPGTAHPQVQQDNGQNPGNLPGFEAFGQPLPGMKPSPENEDVLNPLDFTRNPGAMRPAVNSGIGNNPGAPGLPEFGNGKRPGPGTQLPGAYQRQDRKRQPPPDLRNPKNNPQDPMAAAGFPQDLLGGNQEEPEQKRTRTPGRKDPDGTEPKAPEQFDDSPLSAVS